MRMVLGVDAADRRGPCGVLGLAVALAGEIAQEDRPALGVAIEEGLVVQAFRDQRVDDAEHQRGVGAGDAASSIRRRPRPADRRAAG